MSECPKITPKKEKRKQVQPKHHAAKSKLIAQARRKKIIEGIIEGKTQKQAGIETGLNPNSAERQVSTILKEPEVQKTFRQLLDAQIPDKKLTSKYDSLLESKKYLPTSEGLTPVEDCSVQLRAADSVAKLKGYLVDRAEIGLDITAIELILSALPPEYAEAVRAKLLTIGNKGGSK